MSQFNCTHTHTHTAGWTAWLKDGFLCFLRLFAMLLRSRPLIIAIAIDLVCGSASGVTKYVNWAATGNGDGDTWPNAYTSLETAIAAASVPNSPVTEIWVAQGTYKPTFQLTTDPRSKTFRMVSGVGIYGGFAGNESFLSDRDHIAHVTILSGDLAGNDGPNFTNRSDNAWHVVSAIRVINLPILDGFTIRGGDALGAPVAESGINAAAEAGAGLQILASQGNLGSNTNVRPNLLRCTFEDNRAVKGAGVYITAGGMSGSRIEFRNCVFRNNRATDGGGIYNDGFALGKNEARIFNCLFHDNYATGIGSAIFTNKFPELNLYSSTIVQNLSDGDVGAIVKKNDGQGQTAGEGSARIANCIIYDNVRLNSTTPTTDQFAQLKYDNDDMVVVRFSCVMNYPTGMSDDSNNITTSPLFVSAALDDYRVTCLSPCLDIGSNGEPPSNVNDQFDLNQNSNITERNPDSAFRQRIQSAVIDIGTYEYPSCPGDIVENGVVDIDDLTAVILQWCNPTPPCSCPCTADIAPCGG